MSSPCEWEEADLLALIAEKVEESLNLEYKSCDSLGPTDQKRNEISKDVSAFANSAGGTIVYGMVEVDHLPQRLDVGYDPNVISREWLEQVIHGRVHPRIQGLVIRPVALTTTSPGHVAYVVCIEPSDTAHQAADKKYYKRFNFMSVPMEDYEVRDTMFRAKHPRVDLKSILMRRGNSAKGPGTFKQDCWISFDVVNTGKIAAIHFSVEFSVPRSLAFKEDGGPVYTDIRPSRVDGGTATFLLSGASPLYPDQCQRLGEVPLEVRYENLSAAGGAVFKVRVFAGDAPPLWQDVNAIEIPGLFALFMEFDASVTKK